MSHLLSSPSTRELLLDAAERGARYVAALPGRAVAPAPEAVRGLAAWDTPLPDDPGDATEDAAAARRGRHAATMAIDGPRFFGFVMGGSLPVTVAASWLATAWDQNSGLHSVTPATGELERIALRWLVELLGLPPGTAAGFVTGATVANLTALAAGRHAVLRAAGWDVEADGLFGAPAITVVVGEEVHPTLVKSLGVLGLGRSRVVTVPVDGQGRMRAEALPRLQGPTIVCLQAGNVNTGAFDPAAEIVPRANEAGAWVHVDGAFGLWAAASPELAPLMAGIGDADSWATDAHKWLNVPYDSGSPSRATPRRCARRWRCAPAYLPEAAVRDPSDYTPELSRRGARRRGVGGAAHARPRGLAEMIERNCRQARRFAEGLAAAGHEVLNDVVLNQVLVSFGDPTHAPRASPPSSATAPAGAAARCGRAHRHAHQRLLVGDDRRGRRAKPRRDAALRGDRDVGARAMPRRRQSPPPARPAGASSPRAAAAAAPS
jgi:glutamate/tyrosine decarboxylase-like PLP-dependent enzyme